MKKYVIYLMIVVGMATVAKLKVSQNRDSFSELALKNIEALSSNEYNQYICFGQGEVVCPMTGRKVNNYIQYFDLK